ncbi:excalibur calcium-binding domain-containing protein [Amorphoplanes digitatis]|uniref:Excalibur calcium-binding domain-containing protein n=1 Tax=Actinoplanes digitatis TaxID=1868 RepID=A0A7W7MTU2_9ACTN|nr:excalibur calcium-binding domain-containing protein [Actinoplanes digitatis]MBB4766147.1 hypothetical protein [Actinoplanes digitatis]GID96573.1 hypothetical protein Adi01nite_59850 [Actinoplanes digitatis]
MRTHWIALPTAVLILAGCGQTSKVDEVVDENRDQIPAVVATSASPIATTTAPTATPTTTRPKTVATTKPAPKPKPKPRKTTAAPEPADVYYANCTEVRDAGADPIHRGDPGYSRKLDRDGDGVACE